MAFQWILAWALRCLMLDSTAYPNKDWHGWQSVDTWFVFGDSYSSTGFEVSGVQPNVNNPFGNPSTFGEGTTCDGQNWVNWLTATYNESYVQTYDIAWEASTVDWNRFATWDRPYSNDFIGQLENKFVEHYVGLEWNPSTTLFSMFFGINDIHQTKEKENPSIANAAVFESYKGLVDELYHLGARVFLFLNVPPLDRSPSTTSQAGNLELTYRTIADWNWRVTQMATNLSTTYPDTAIFLFDINRMFNEILDDPRSHIETAYLKNSTDYCEVYQRRLFHPNPPAPQPHYYDAKCGCRVDEYFWIDGSHPTWPVHKAIAAELIRMFKRGPLEQQEKEM